MKLAAMPTPLDALRAGDAGTIMGFAGSQPPRRLLELGLLPGTRVEVVRLAPLGDPMDLRVRGFHLSLRKREAARVLVKRA